MKLIKISENILVNPERISKVEMRERKGEKVVVVTLDDKELIVEVATMDFMNDLMNAGIVGDNKNWQFWAG